MSMKRIRKYTPNEKEKYMCSKHKDFFKNQLITWRSDIIKSNKVILDLNEDNSNISAPDILDQASSQTEKSIEIRTLNRQKKLLLKIDQALNKIKNDTYGFCEETGEPIGLKRLIARPIATLSIEAQEKHEKNKKIFADS
tara:strand:- start:478 stop:897 length:420 start_codon:yes stop_codon:yes gene_type:complete